MDQQHLFSSRHGGTIVFKGYVATMMVNNGQISNSTKDVHSRTNDEGIPARMVVEGKSCKDKG